MGASGWSYYVPYDRDHKAALDRLRTAIFEAGRYYKRGRRTPKSIAEAIELAAEDGTHSILDIDRVAPAPTEPGAESLRQLPREPGKRGSWFASYSQNIGTARELHPDDLRALLGTTTPTRDQVDAAVEEITEHRARGLGTIIVIYAEGKPSELAFIGFSGD